MRSLRVLVVLAAVLAALFSITTESALPSGETANIWVDAVGGTTTCGDLTVPDEYDAATACTWAEANATCDDGDIVGVKGGSYGNVFLAGSNSRSSVCTFVVVPEETASMTGFFNGVGTVGDTGADYIKIVGPVVTNEFFSDNTSNVEIDGWDIDGDGASLQIFHVESTDGPFTIRNSDVHNVEDAPGMSILTGDGPWVFDHNRFYDVIDTTSGAVHTECMWTDMANVTMTRNHFFNCAVMDVFLTGRETASNWLVENNVFEKPTGSTNENAFAFRSGSAPSPSPDNFDFHYNTVNSGLQINNTDNSPTSGGFRVTGNYFRTGPPCGLANSTYSYNVTPDGVTNCSGTGHASFSLASIDAGFVDPQTDGTEGDYALLSGSPLRNIGNVSAYPTLDLLGVTRYYGSAADIGAFEFVEEPETDEGNLWIDDDGGTCDRSSSPAIYNDATACDTTEVYDAADTNDTIFVRDGTYGSWSTDTGTKTLTIVGETGELPAFGELTVNFDNVTFKNLEFLRVNTETGSNPEHLTFEDFVIDGQASDDDHALKGGSGGNHTFVRGSIGNVTDRNAVEYSGDAHVFDSVVFHDVVLSSEGEQENLGNMCFYAIVVPDLTITNSTFHNCATVDLFFSYGGWWDPVPDPYGGVTLENNVFEHSRFAEGQDWHYNSVVVHDTGNDSLDDWVVRNNTFETGVRIDVGEADDSKWVGNLGAWDCITGVTYKYNVGEDCGGTGDHEVSPAEATGPPSTMSVVYPEEYDWVEPASFDFHLGSASEAIGAADATDAPATDRDGNPRGNDPDAGAYERIP